MLEEYNSIARLAECCSAKFSVPSGTLLEAWVIAGHHVAKVDITSQRTARQYHY